MNRKEYNEKCLNLLSNLINQYPDMRLEQLIYCLDAKEIIKNGDLFNEEPKKTFERWTESVLNK